MCDSMGLFDNKTEEQLIIEAYNKVAGVSMVNCKVVVGTYGNEDIIAGAMIGETGKYLAMANYGNPKWENSVLEFHVNGVVFTNPGWSIMYHDIIDLKISRDGFRHSELLFSLSDGGKVLCEVGKYEGPATIRRINELREDYLKRIDEEEKEAEKEREQEKYDKNMDRLLRAAELHERGLLSQEEFEDIKTKVLNKKPETNHDTKQNQEDIYENFEVSSFKYCPQCGTEIEKDYHFCINCGYELKK